MMNWIGMILFHKVNIIIMLLIKKFEQNLVHEFREKPKMVVGDGGSFIENLELF
jgi:hypothetical protein